jgi:hypothetical protein
MHSTLGHRPHGYENAQRSNYVPETEDIPGRGRWNGNCKDEGALQSTWNEQGTKQEKVCGRTW